MASITRKQVESANSKLANGFELDVFYYLMHNEKTATKRIEIGENTFAELQLMYMDEHENHGGYNVPTGRQIPVCHVAKQIKDGDFYQSFGLGRWVKIGEPQNKKLFSTLQKLSGTIDIDMMVKIASGEPDTIEQSKALFC